MVVGDMNYFTIYNQWLESDYIDLDTKKELRLIENNENEIKERFYKNLDFGTGGIRGIIGAGTNRMNKYTVQKITQCLANYLNEINDSGVNKVAIAYDSRNYSNIFAEEVAIVLAANDIKVYLFEDMRATPELSFAVRSLKCSAGVVITASHNPSDYNGYKVYGPDGGQLTEVYANGIIKWINNLDSFAKVKRIDKHLAIKKELISYIGEEVDRKYIEKVKALSIRPKISDIVPDFRFVYTPLHGTGLRPITKCLRELGFKNIHVVESQAIPNGNFPTVKAPNPEELEAFKLGIELAEKVNADILLGTDPDTDRVGVVVKNDNGEYEALTGNQVGALLTNYILSSKSSIDEKDVIIKTIVTSDFGSTIAKSFGATVINTLTGFKYIGEKIKQFEEDKLYNFLLGYEESHGYLVGTFVRDKDAIVSSMLIVEMAAYYKSLGKNLYKVLQELYETHGFYCEYLKSYIFSGIDGQMKINSIMRSARDFMNLKKFINDIDYVEDYMVQRRIFLESNFTEEIELPKANVIKICFNNKSWVAIRPSGTEPKLKIYYSSVASNRKSSEEILNRLIKGISEFIESSLI